MKKKNKTKALEKQFVEEKTEIVAEEKNSDNNSENTSQEEFISEFAPEPIKIPKYNKEKEMKKAEKADEKNRNRKSKKAKKRRRILIKIVTVIRNILLFVLLLSVIFATVASLLVKMSTSKYSVESAIRTNSPETFVVGKIKNPAKINLKVSSPKASVADVLRDNSMIVVTYADIERAVSKSSYPKFVAGIAYDIISHYVYGTEYKAVTKDEIKECLLENVSYIKLVTGVELGESACADIAKYATKSAAIKSLSAKNIASQPASEYTYITSVIFSTTVLIGLVVALMLLMVLTAIGCKGFAHKMIGWAAVISGIFVAVIGFFVKAPFSASGDFITCVVGALTKSFHHTSVIYGAIAFLTGILIMLVGKAMNDDDEEEYEEDYIDEIEQVATAQ